MLRLLSIFLYLIGGLYFIFFGFYVILISLLIGPNALYNSIPFLARIQLFLLGAWVKRKNKIPNDRQYIIMMNHTSFADVFIGTQPLRCKYTALLAAWNFKIPLWGTMLRSFKAIPIYRRDKHKAIQAIHTAEDKIKESGYHVVIFPEGTRTIDGKLQKFKKGGFHMAINSNTPILPMIVKGGFRYKPKTRWYIKPSILSIEVGEPIDTSKYSIESLNQLMDDTYLEFQKLLDK